jgi:hypothetical protein
VKPLILAVGADLDVDAAHGCSLIRVEAAEVAAAGQHAIDEGHDRVGIAGTDADAAVVAEVAAASGRRIGLALLGHSDLLRTFALRDRDGVARLVGGRPYPTDLGLVEGGWGRSPFINSVVAGMPASPWGVTPWTPGRPGSVGVDAGRSLLREDVVGVLAMNGQIWSGMTVAPRATLVDGALEVQLLAARRWRLLALRSAMRHGLHVARSDVTRRSLTAGRVSIPERWWVAADGRRLGRGSFGLSVHASAFDLLI